MEIIKLRAAINKIEQETSKQKQYTKSLKKSIQLTRVYQIN